MPEDTDHKFAQPDVVAVDGAITPAELAIGVVVLGVFASVVSLVLFPFGPAFGFTFRELFLFLGLSWSLTAASGRDPKQYTKLAFPGVPMIALALLLGVANYLAAVIPLYRFSTVLFPGWPRHTSLMAVVIGDGTVFDWTLVAIGFVAAPLCEEFCFRGILLQGLAQKFGKAVAIVATAVLFSATHLDGLGFLSRFETGILLGILFVSTKSLWPCIVVHLANNLTAVGLSFWLQEMEDGAVERYLSPGLSLLAGVTLVLAYALLRNRAPKRPMNEEDTIHTPRKVSKVFLPWGIGALAFLLAVIVFDRRGITLNVADINVRTPKTDAEKMTELRKLRARAHKGEIPVQTYVEYRRSLSAAP